MFQAWGNTPEQFALDDTAGAPGRELLDSLASWTGGESHDALPKIARRVGMPTHPLEPSETRLSRLDGALRWDYRVALAGYPIEVLVLDCRTARQYPPPPSLDTAAAGLLNPDAFGVQIGAPIGSVVVVHHKPNWQLDRERVREQQAVATARFVERLLDGRADVPVILMGDFDAAPDAASIRFFTGKQSLGGMSVRYDDAWETLPGSPARKQQ